MAFGSKRIGFYSLRKTARAMCQYLFKFSPVIRLAYPDNALLLAALTTAEAACHELVRQIDDAREPGV